MQQLQKILRVIQFKLFHFFSSGFLYYFVKFVTYWSIIINEIQQPFDNLAVYTAIFEILNELSIP